MNTRRRTFRGVAVAAVAGALLVSGCGSDQAGDAASRSLQVRKGAPAPTPAVESAAGTASAPVVSPAPRKDTEESIPVENVPTELPPGDPGLDAPSVPDPGVPEEGRDHHEDARTEVPDEAMLDAGTVSGVLGGQWRAGTAAGTECVEVPDAVATRTVTFGSEGSQVTQVVATHHSLEEADQAVAAMARQLADCGWQPGRDPRLGTASASADRPDGSQTVAVTSAEGVTVTLLGSGEVATGGPRWLALLDVAMGTSCSAAPHGCH
jgi:hypothetical protein